MTDTPMPPDREREIRTLEQAATKGPWRSVEATDADVYKLLSETEGTPIQLLARVAAGENAAFIADARQAIPALLAELDRLRARVAELEGAPADEAAELAEGQAGLDAMRAEHPAPCRVPDSPDCTCPYEPTLPLCGKTVAINGNVYAPCARHAGHGAAYCWDSAHNHFFLAAPDTSERTA